MAATGMKKGIALIMLANLINLIIGLVNGFVIPKYLSVDSYAMIKTFTLYGTYAGVFHLGYLDGMYLKYGGRNLYGITSSEYGKDFWNITIMQLLLSGVVFFIGLIRSDFVFSSFGVVLFFRNITSCFQMLFQATGEFKLYSSALNFGTILSFIISIFLIFVCKTDNYRLYISAQIFATIVVTLYLGFLLNSKIHYFSCVKLDKSIFKENIGTGFVLMLGNFSNNLFTSIDRWIVKIFMTAFHFAAYSFAASVDSLITVFITPLYVTLYNDFCRNKNSERIVNIKRYVLLWSSAIVVFAFPAKWFIESYLDKYTASLPVVFVLFSTQMLYSVIKGVYVNYFKAQKLQKEYFKQIVSMLCFAIVLSLAVFYLFKTMLSISVAALIVAMIWLIINEIKFVELRFGKKDWIFVIAIMGAYLFCGLAMPVIWGGIVYVVFLLISSLLLMPRQVRELSKMVSAGLSRYLGLR